MVTVDISARGVTDVFISKDFGDCVDVNEVVRSLDSASVVGSSVVDISRGIV